MDKNISRDAKDMMDEFAIMGRKFSRLVQEASIDGNRNQNRQFGKAAKAYRQFFGELKKLYKIL
tara:strand:+ start:419 stop:610 length:192 start_codon:yes stop_codon:yes gene_type:complete